MSLFEQKSMLARLMATENMIIRQQDVATASFDILNRILTVPILDSNLSKDLYDLFMGHECGHALWTPVEGMKKAKADKINMSVLNVVEDSRIERKIKTKYPGIRACFIKAYGELFERNFFETEGKDVNEYNFIDRLNLHCKIGASLALPFSEDEKILLDEVENTETFQDAVEVTKKICEFMAEQMIEVPEPKEVKVRIKFEGEGDIEDGEPGGSGEDGGDNDSDIDVEITVQKSDESAAPQEGQGAGKNSSETGSGAGRNLQDLIDQIRSHTDDAYHRNESNLFSKGKEKIIYGNIPKYDVRNITDHKTYVKLLKNENYSGSTSEFNKYRREASKVVSYLVKEFELRKNADQMKRAQTAKTGDLNMNRLFSYSFTEDIFKKITVVPQGKSHGLVMFLDWSGSMSGHLAGTIKQLINLVLFCKKVNIPYDVYNFIDAGEQCQTQNHKTGDMILSRFGLINVLSSKMSAMDFTYAASALMRMGGCQSDHGYKPSFMQMNGTPLNEAVIAAFEIVPKFQKDNRLQIVNTVFLTDGEGCPIHQMYNEYAQRDFTSMVIRDPVTHDEEIYDRRKFMYGSHTAMHQTDCLIRLLRKRTHSNVVGFFVAGVGSVQSRSEYFFPEKMTHQERYALNEKIREDFKKKDHLIVTSTGYNEFYVLKSTALEDDGEEELTFKENASTRGMATAFAKYAGNKITSRIVLNRFIGLIS